MRRYFLKRGNSFIAADEDSRANMRKIPDGDWVSVDVRRPHNLRKHRKLFAMIKLLVDNCDEYKTTRQALNALKLATGHCDYHIIDGQRVAVAASISFESLPPDEFDDFFDRACDWIADEVLKIERYELDAAVAQKLLDMAL